MYAYEIDNGYSPINTVDDVLAILKRDLFTAKQSLNTNRGSAASPGNITSKDRGDFIKAANVCETQAAYLEGVIAQIEGRTPHDPR